MLGPLLPSEYILSIPSLFLSIVRRLGQTFSSRFNLEFRNRLYSSLPPEFPSYFVEICKDNFGKELDTPLFMNLDTLGFLDLYENLITDMCYGQISRWVHENCPGEWTMRFVSKIRDWLLHSVVLWMYGPWARGIKTGRWFL